MSKQKFGSKEPVSMCGHDTAVGSIFKRVGVNRWGFISVEKVKQRAAELDKYLYSAPPHDEEHPDDAMENEILHALFDNVKTNENGLVHIKLFDAWLVSEDADQRHFVKTFIERELSGADKGTMVDVLLEYPSPAADAQVSIIAVHFQPGALGISYDRVSGRVTQITSRAGQGYQNGVHEGMVIKSVNGQSLWKSRGDDSWFSELMLKEKMDGNDDYYVNFSEVLQVDPLGHDCKKECSWSPLRKRTESVGVIVGYGHLHEGEKGVEHGTRVRMQDTGQEVTARRGQLKTRTCQKGPQNKKYALSVMASH